MDLCLDMKERKNLIAILDCFLSFPGEDIACYIQKAMSLKSKLEKSLKKIKPRSAKNKGLNYQKKIACVIGEIIGIEATQSDDSLIQSRLSSQNGTDIIFHGEAKEKFPYSVECKSCSSISLPAWIRQAKENETEKEKWLLFIHSPKLDDKDVVTMSLETFKKIFLDSKKIL